MTRVELDTLIATAGRRPAHDAVLLWFMVWIVTVTLFAFFAPGFFFDGATLVLERIALAIVGGGLLAAALCALYTRYSAKKVAAAQNTLRALADQMKTESGT